MLRISLKNNRVNKMVTSLVTSSLNSPLSLKQAVEALKFYIMENKEIAWSWHCLILHTIEKITSKDAAHLFTAEIMCNLFDTDTACNPAFPDTIRMRALGP